MTDDGPRDTTRIDSELSRRGVLGAVAASGVGWLGAGRATWEPDGAGADGSIDPTLIEADESAGFNFPYYLYAPSDPADVPLLVEPVNSGGASDDFQEDLDAAERTIKRGNARRIADAVGMPLLVPVFANPASGEFYNRFVQSLDTETMNIESGKFARIDRQLLRMIDDARDRLADEGIDVPPEVSMNGFSASGNFVNNFAALHPDRVSTVTAGAINGTATLPLSEAKGYTLNYQIGIADLPDLIGESFDAAAWQSVDQLCYMGAEEQRPVDDTIPYRDVWSAEQASKALAVYGDHMQEDRMPYCEWVYDREDADARFEVYDGVGHSYNSEIISDIISFHTRHNGVSRTGFSRRPKIGDASVAVDVALPPSDSESALPTDEVEIRVFADGTDLTADPLTVAADASATREIDLDWALRSDQTATVAVLPPGNGTLDDAFASGSVRVLTRVEIAEPPTVNDNEVTVEYELSSEFRRRSIVLVVPPGDAKYWQRSVQVGWVSPGEARTETVEIEDGGGTSLDLGEDVQVWMIPGGNQVPERTIATDTEPIVGVAFSERPQGGDESVALQVAVPTRFAGAGVVRLSTGGSDTVELGRVSTTDGTTQRFEIPEDASIRPLEGGTELTASLVLPDADEPLDSTTVTVERTDVATVAFEAEPADLDDEVTLSYSLANVYEPEDFVGIRLYGERGSSWGTFLETVDPGIETTETFVVPPDEPVAPFSDGDSLEVALVDDDDPYARNPLATDSAVVGGGGGRPTLRPRIVEPSDGATVPADQSLGVVVATSNVGDAAGETSVGIRAGEWTTTSTVEVSPGEREHVEVAVPDSELDVDARTDIEAVVDGTTDRVTVTGTTTTQETETTVDENRDDRTTTTQETRAETETSADEGGEDGTTTRMTSDDGGGGTEGTETSVPTAEAPASDTARRPTGGGVENGTGTPGDDAGETPGFAPGQALAALGGAWYALRRLAGSQDDAQSDDGS